MASPRFPFISPEDYLAGEHEAEEKHEYFDGEIVAMAGTSFTHVLIVSNLARILAEQLKGTRCREMTSDMRVSVAARRAFCYPDIAVACFPFESISGKTDTLTNPTILIEVLSPSTRASDRNRKVPLYREIPSLKGYLLVEQERVAVEYGHRALDIPWEVETTSDLSAVLDLPSIQCSIPVSQIYADLELGPRPWPVSPS